MKKLFVIINLIILSLTSALGCWADSLEETQWRRISENNYVDFDGIVGTTDIYGFTFLLKSYNKGQYEPVNGKAVFYTLSQYTVDCAKKRYKIGIMDSYGRNGNFITGDYNRYASFQPIVSGTAVDAFAKKFCRE